MAEEALPVPAVLHAAQTPPLRARAGVQLGAGGGGGGPGGGDGPAPQRGLQRQQQQFQRKGTTVHGSLRIIE